MSSYKTAELGFGVDKDYIVLRYKKQVIIANTGNGAITFYDNQELPQGIKWDWSKPNGAVRNMEEAFRLIDAIPIAKPERLYAVTGNIDQINKSSILAGVDFVPIGPRCPNKAVAHFEDIQKARDVYNFMRDNKLAALRDWLDRYGAI